MLQIRSLRASVCGIAFLTTALGAHAQQAAPKKKVTNASDLPRFSYPITGSASDLLKADDATFTVFLLKFTADLNSMLNDYDIQNKTTLRELLSDKENVALVNNDRDAAQSSVEELAKVQEKPDDQALFGLGEYPLLSAWKQTGTRSGPDYEKAYMAIYAGRINALPWPIVQEDLKEMNAGCKFYDPDSPLNYVKSGIDPLVVKTHTLSFQQAGEIVNMRAYMKSDPALEPQRCTVVAAYVKSHTTTAPDIWPAREVTLTAADKLTPVRIGIWDSGIDTSLYPDQLFTDPHPGAHGPHGLAYDIHGKLFAADLQTLTPAQQSIYPQALAFSQGLFDTMVNVDSPAAADTIKFYKTASPEQKSAFFKEFSFIDQYMHGTHVAGIAVRGNPAARLVVVQFNDRLTGLPFAPTVEWANQFKADFAQIGDYLRDNNVRVVNMSWSDQVSEFEEWLSQTSTEKDPVVRKKLAEQIYAIWKDAVVGTITRAPNTLFICAAGNSSSDSTFDGGVPASLHLPNLVTVGAVDQAGLETNFSSYGPTVVLDADGYQVESYVPGGTKLKESGTSMASPNVANLAAKLIALKPSLTPAETIALIEKTADASPDGRLHVINPKAAVALLQQSH